MLIERNLNMNLYLVNHLKKTIQVVDSSKVIRKFEHKGKRFVSIVGDIYNEYVALNSIEEAKNEVERGCWHEIEVDEYRILENTPKNEDMKKIIQHFKKIEF